METVDILAPVISPTMALPFAGPIWLESKRPYVKDRSIDDYSIGLKGLCERFGSVQLQQSTIDGIRNYQFLRRTKAGAGCVNEETNTLSQFLRQASLWSRLVSDYKPLPLPI